MSFRGGGRGGRGGFGGGRGGGMFIQYPPNVFVLLLYGRVCPIAMDDERQGGNMKPIGAQKEMEEEEDFHQLSSAFLAGS
jgi:hypothetical protein